MSNRVRIKRPLDNQDMDLVERLYAAECRSNFYEFRRFMTPGLIEGWFQAEIAEHLQQFYLDWKAGLSPVMVIEAPPQHGKSRQVIDFVSYVAGLEPDIKAIYASYSDTLGTNANRTIQRIMDSARYKKVFAHTRLADAGSRSGASRNTDLLEFIGPDQVQGALPVFGSFRNTTVNGQITGLGLNLGIIDDPMKGRKETNSLIIRDSTWSWFTDDFFTRFAEGAALLMIMTRWNVDDPVGRFIERYPDAKVLKYPALGRVVRGQWVAEDGERGEALFPEMKTEDFLRKRKTLMVNSSWQSLYQQSPIVVGGDMFPIEKFKLVKAVPQDIRRSVRYWDKAGTEGGGAATAGVLIHHLVNGRFIVEDCIRGHWSALNREARIKQTAELDNNERFVETWVEQEPGSGGKESAESTIRNLAGYRVYADRVTGSKEIRAEPYAAQVQAGNVDILAAEWNKEFLSEHEMFPNGKKKDMVDAAGGACVKLTVRKSTYDSSMSWVK